MKNTWEKIFAIALLFMFVLAPFAGLAPLMLFLLGAGMLWALGAIAQVLFFGDDIEGSPESGESETR